MLAAAFLAGEWSLDDMASPGRRALGRRAWARTVAPEVLAACHRPLVQHPLRAWGARQLVEHDRDVRREFARPVRR